MTSQLSSVFAAPGPINIGDDPGKPSVAALFPIGNYSCKFNIGCEGPSTSDFGYNPKFVFTAFRRKDTDRFLALTITEYNDSGNLIWQLGVSIYALFGDKDYAISNPLLQRPCVMGIYLDPVDNNKLIASFGSLDREQNFNFTCKISRDFTLAEDCKLFFPLQQSFAPSSPANAIANANFLLSQSLNNNNTNDLGLTITAQSDQFGLNLEETTAIVYANKPYPNGYPKRDIGKCIPGNSNNTKGLIETYYSEHPDIRTVLKGRKGSTLYEQTSYINRRYNSGESDCEFYSKIVQYATLKYMLAGLACNSKFSLYWLYSDHDREFLNLVRNSEFRKFLSVFKERGLIGYNKYFKASYKKNGTKRTECNGSTCNKSKYEKKWDGDRRNYKH